MWPSLGPIAIDLQVCLSGVPLQIRGELSRESVMSKLPFADAGGPAPALRIWTPEEHREGARESGEDTRSAYPVLPPRSLFAELAETCQSGPPLVSPEDRQRIRETLTLPAFYRECMSSWREQEVQSGKVKSGTVSKERQALNRWSAWEAESPPEGWPAEAPWQGCPIGFLAGGYLDRFYRWMSPPRYAAETVKSTRNHLQAVLNFAVRVGVLDRAPQPSPLELEDADDVEEDLATVWTEAEIEALYRGMRGQLDLQTAFVLSLNCGARPVDLFLLRWEKHVRLRDDPPRVLFRARKTGKKHGIPLHPVTVAHLLRLQREHLCETDGLLFPRLTSAVAKDAERSKAARRRTALTKRIMRTCGAPEHEKPWQVTRATCCSRLDNCDRTAKAGSWAIGQAETSGTKLGDTFYSNPSSLMTSIIMRAPWPAALAAGANHCAQSPGG